MSSDGGGLLLKAVDEQLGLTEAFAACLRDGRDASKVKHSLKEAIQQRVFGIALGYPDANDATRLAHDPIHKLMIGRTREAVDPVSAVRNRFRLGSRVCNAMPTPPVVQQQLAGHIAEGYLARSRAISPNM